MNTIVTTYMNLARLIYMNLNSQTLYMNCNSNMNESNRYMNKFTASQIYIWMYTLHMNLSTRIYIWIGISRHWNMNFSETYIWIIYCSINKCMNVNEAYINILLKWILLQNGNHTCVEPNTCITCGKTVTFESNCQKSNLKGRSFEAPDKGCC